MTGGAIIRSGRDPAISTSHAMLPPHRSPEAPPSSQPTSLGPLTLAALPAASEPLSATAAVLLHELPDGTHHFDWLLLAPGDSPSSSDDALLISFRCPGPVDDLPSAEAAPPIMIERIPPHRVRYLTFQGPLSAGRGSVRRVAHGVVEEGALTDFAGVFRIWWAPPENADPGPVPPGIRSQRTRELRAEYTLKRLGNSSWSVSARPVG